MSEKILSNIAQNYKDMVANGERTWDQIIDQAHKNGSVALEAWARAQAGTDQHSAAAAANPEAGEKPIDEYTVQEAKDRLAADFPDVETKSSWVRQQWIDALEKAIADKEAADKAAAEGDFAELDDAELLEYAIEAGAATEGELVNREELIERIKTVEAAKADTTSESTAK